MQISLLNGIYSDNASDLRTSYPINYVPVAKDNGVSAGYLRPAEGLVQFAPGIGVDRGAIRWNDVCYRVSGQRLIRVNPNGSVDVLGEIPGTGQVTMDYSFDRLAVAGNGGLYYWDGTTFTQVTDTDLGTVLSFVWVDGYFLTTDGEFLVVTELADPTQVDPLKYGSSEVDPDPVKTVLKLRNEPYALNRFTAETFQNVGGTGFPFQRIDGAQFTRGTVGTHTACVFLENIAFVGGGRDEALAVWLGASGQTIKISTQEIDEILAEYPESVLANQALLETRVYGNHNHLYLHLPDKTLVFDGIASQELGQQVWFILQSGLDPENPSIYRARNFVWCYSQWLFGDPTASGIGTYSKETSDHWGQIVGWMILTNIIYNENMGAIFHDVELATLPGRIDVTVESSISTQHSSDGMAWSMPRSIRVGTTGNRAKRLVWLQQGSMRNFRMQKFKGTSKARFSFLRLDARIEPLGV